MSQSIMKSAGRFAKALGQTVKSAGKMLLTPAGKLPQAGRHQGPLVILGNGPSLRKNLQEDMARLQRADTLAVNFAANSPEFRKLRPHYYVLADPHFFQKVDSDENVKRLIANLNAVDWPMMLLIPSSARGSERLFDNENVEVATFRFTAIEGFEWLENLLFSRRLGMPRPRNVMIPAIMIGMWLGYERIVLLGADHSWLSTLRVNDRNEVVSVQPHFYKEDEKEEQRIRSEYVSLPLDSVLESMMIAFRSYRRIRRFADGRGISIINATPDSMIDAFERGNLEGVGDRV